MTFRERNSSCCRSCGLQRLRAERRLAHRPVDPRDAQIAALREALRPFAEAAIFVQGVPDDAETFVHGRATAGDFHRARAAFGAQAK